jgi:hypothetical protein
MFNGSFLSVNVDSLVQCADFSRSLCSQCEFTSGTQIFYRGEERVWFFCGKTP